MNILAAFYAVLHTVFAITVHEYAHAYAAREMGDRTAERAGRLTLNPLAHVDWLFSIVVPIVTWLLLGVPVGACKPVPVAPWEYSSRGKGEILVSLAGPAANLVLASNFAIGLLVPNDPLLHQIAAFGVRVNLALALFNLLPIPGLDGWNAMKGAWRMWRAWAAR